MFWVFVVVFFYDCDNNSVFCKAETLANSSLSGEMAAGSVMLLIHLIWRINIEQRCLIDSRLEGEEEADMH